MTIVQTNRYVPQSICLNLCSTCNLRCAWCYNQAKQSSTLSYNSFSDFYQNIVKNYIKNVTLIGGEPTLHPKFFDILDMLKNKNLYLVTNGLIFSDKEFLKDILQLGVKGISVSLKGYDEGSFYRTTQLNSFNQLVTAIKNLVDTEIDVKFTYTYATPLKRTQIQAFIEFLKELKIRQIVINDVRPYFVETDIVKNPIVDNIDAFILGLNESGIITFFRPSNPFCKYKDSFIKNLINQGKILSSCAVKLRQGFFFSDRLELIPCNELVSIVFGTYNKDFKTFSELVEFWNTPRIQKFFDNLSGYPKLECKQCDLWRQCGGNCILHWI